MTAQNAFNMAIDARNTQDSAHRPAYDAAVDLLVSMAMDGDKTAARRLADLGEKVPHGAAK